ncbi:hypothetical protein HOR19_gp30 [Phage MedPE-SWcel-C56]|uniref:Uncharacterized protein n=1 Tax=Phage MedPE-SWcel-C56 TaxID=1871314 RepID=A0A1B1IY17_9CAUD|nr:hypothetical protein HOR19_gp30 [Phage MedPE-SWcel-C56]ANS06223.1 hypothetical protein [Phage MedPE-SWcel-C56]
MPTTKPVLMGEFKRDDGLHLRELPNGGWLVTSPSREMGVRETELGAYSDADDMLRALVLLLNPLKEAAR